MTVTNGITHLDRIKSVIFEWNKEEPTVNLFGRTITIRQLAISMIEKRYLADHWSRVYTDGYMIKEAILELESSFFSNYFPLGTYISNFNTEMYVILKDFMTIMNYPHSNINTFQICNTSYNITIHYELQNIKENPANVTKSPKSYCIILQWIPSQHATPGNKAADKLAKRDTSLP